MDLDLIKALIAVLDASDLSELEYTRDGATLRLTKGATPARPAPEASTPAAPAPAVPAQRLLAPSFGVVHLQRTPGAPPLVVAGQAVTAGQVLCVIEAMKVFTELRAERDAVVAAVLVQTGQEVEAGQALIELRDV